MTLVTGDVRTHFWDNVQGSYIGIPDASPYVPIKAKVEAMMRGQTNPAGAHSRAPYAKDVVNDLLRRGGSPPAHIRRGFLALTMWIMSALLPYWVLDWLYSRTGELDKLKSILALQGPDADVRKTR